ncbi:MAG TPA: hypothetical protein ENN86_02895, partial [Desulfobacteraceae bacterium]|nr:hypothetical protein [Desulfobacteraceae bacterium]
DPIEWHESYLRDFYTSLNRLKKENPALHNGKWGGDFNAYSVTGDDDVYVYARSKDDSRVVTIINFDGEAAEFSVHADVAGDYSDYFSGETISISGEGVFMLDGWGYMVLVGR